MAPLLIEKDGVSIHLWGRDHLPPHVHAFSGDDEVLVEIRTGDVYAGYLSPKKLKVVKEWLNESENRKVVEENFYELNPRLRASGAIKKINPQEKKRKKQGGK